MLDKFTINLDKSFLPLFERFVAAIERIAPPPSKKPPRHSGDLMEGDGDDLISMTDAEYAKVDLQGQLDDLVEALSEKGYNEANADELAKLTELKARLAEVEMEDLDGNSDD